MISKLCAMGCCSSTQPFTAESGSKAARGALALHHGLDRAQKAPEIYSFFMILAVCVCYCVLLFRKTFLSVRITTGEQ